MPLALFLEVCPIFSESKLCLDAEKLANHSECDEQQGSSLHPVAASSRLPFRWPSQNKRRMRAGRILLFESSILFAISSATVFNIERQFIATQNGTFSKDLFTNPGGCSRSNICTNFKGVCHNPTGSVIGHCCVCECRNEKNLFYSLRNGCTTSKDAIQRTKIAGIKSSCCYFCQLQSAAVFYEISNAHAKVK